MQFDDFDKKIKEAAEHHHPAYEEKAWDQMEKLLDKHLPVEKDDRRKIIFLLFFLLLTGTGVYLAISKPWQQKKDITPSTNVVAPANEKSDSPATETLTKEKTNDLAGKPSSPKTGEGEPVEKTDAAPSESNATNKVTEDKKRDVTSTQIQPGKPKSIKESAVSNYPVKKTIAGAESVNQYPVADIAGNQKNPRNKSVSVSGKSKKIEANSESPTGNDKIDTQRKEDLNTVVSAKPVQDNNTNNPANSSAAVNNDSASKPKAADIVKADTGQKKEEIISKKPNPKPGKQRRSGFAITFTAGPDLSAVGLKDAGKVKLTYGAGISYSLNRFTIRSGFYVAKKVYTAGPDDYHPPHDYLPYNVDLKKIDADCKLYEIPVTVSYNFSERKKHNWFASLGLSSYLMKKETYGYSYKYWGSSTTLYKDWTLKNGENHVLSILDLSAGYERKINNTISIIAEPYFKIPVNGIGFGKIKLNSAGVLFTVSVKPFATKK